jgi:hypothetical protein
MNYAELVAEVESYTQNTYAVADMNTFIRQAEQRIYNAAQLANLRRNVTSALIANNKYIAPPANFLSLYSFAVVDPTTGEYTYLLNKDVNFIREAYPRPNATGKPKHYAIFGAQSNDPTTLTLLVGPTPDLAYSVELHYFYYPESIVTAGNTWLGEHFDVALLNGTLSEAITFMKGEADLVALYDKRFTQAIALLKNLADGKQRGDAYRDGQVRTPAV